MLARGDAVAAKIEAEPDVQRARVIFDHERWYLGKMAPKVFGEKLDVAVTGDVSFGERLAAARKPATDAE